MFKTDEIVNITGGHLQGRRGIVRAVMPEGTVLVTVEIRSAPGMHWGVYGTVTTCTERYVAPEHLERMA